MTLFAVFACFFAAPARADMLREGYKHIDWHAKFLGINRHPDWHFAGVLMFGQPFGVSEGSEVSFYKLDHASLVAIPKSSPDAEAFLALISNREWKPPWLNPKQTRMGAFMALEGAIASAGGVRPRSAVRSHSRTRQVVDVVEIVSLDKEIQIVTTRHYLPHPSWLARWIAARIRTDYGEPIDPGLVSAALFYPSWGIALLGLGAGVAYQRSRRRKWQTPPSLPSPSNPS